MMNRHALLVFFLLVVVTASPAAYDGGGYAGSVLRMGWGVRAAGMGRAVVAGVEGAEAVYHNPAGLAFTDHPTGSLFHRTLSLDRSQSSAGFCYPLSFIPEARAAVGASWFFLHVGGIDGRDAGGNETGTYSYQEHVANFAFGARPLDWLGIGVGARLMFTDLAEETAQGGAVDIALRGEPLDWLSLGVVVHNVIGSYKWKTAAATEEQMPLEYVAGVSFTPLKGLRAAFDYAGSSELPAEYRLGAEYWITPTLAARLGYEFGDEVGAGELSAGGSLRTTLFGETALTLHYAYRTDPLSTGPSHAVALELDF
jgi:hypothetical protein